MKPTLETRKEAHEFIKPLKNTRQTSILSAMGNDTLTAREIAYRMGFGDDLNKVRPRITELVEQGKIVVTEIRCCPVTQRRVAAFKAVVKNE